MTEWPEVVRAIVYGLIGTGVSGGAFGLWLTFRSKENSEQRKERLTREAAERKDRMSREDRLDEREQKIIDRFESDVDKLREEKRNEIAAHAELRTAFDKFIAEKYTPLFEENNRLRATVDTMQKQMDRMQKEIDTLRHG